MTSTVTRRSSAPTRPSTHRSVHRRWTGALAAATVGVLALAGCASGDAAAADGVMATPAEEGALPVTMTHAFGETTITEAPERVVTVGWATQDVVAAFGAVPVGIPETWGGDEEGYSPWFRAEVEELGGTMPEILNYSDAGDLDFEQVLALEPDVILAPHSGLTEVEYNRLTEIAPTVAYPEKPWASESWQSLVEIVGDSLGQPAKADEIIAQTQGQLDTVKEENPKFADTTFAYGLTLSDGGTEAGIYIPTDLRVQFLTDLGLQNTPAMDTVLGTVEGDNWYGAVSLEELDTIPADLFVAWSNSPEELEYTLNHPTFKLWEPIATGHYLFLESEPLAMATNAPTPLSIPWALDEFVPMLNSAIDGNGVGGAE
ncbi:ABC transporter substrate-binding protein [Pseudoclavibacter sp. JSM 162008]|uniref:ABC transporter substrate-binding protein n=1 Tax=Pseudoclavibacter sp. JSM 162008 TaxID=3229855 RepID=UPI0035247440